MALSELVEPYIAQVRGARSVIDDWLREERGVGLGPRTRPFEKTRLPVMRRSEPKRLLRLASDCFEGWPDRVMPRVAAELARTVLPLWEAGWPGADEAPAVIDAVLGGADDEQLAGLTATLRARCKVPGWPEHHEHVLRLTRGEATRFGESAPEEPYTPLPDAPAATWAARRAGRVALAAAALRLESADAQRREIAIERAKLEVFAALTEIQHGDGPRWVVPWLAGWVESSYEHGVLDQAPRYALPVLAMVGIRGARLRDAYWRFIDYYWLRAEREVVADVLRHVARAVDATRR